MRTTPLFLIGLLAVALLCPRSASATWPAFGRAITTASGNQTHPAIASDGADGAIIVFQDDRFINLNIFAQHVLASGEVDAGWRADGVGLLNDPFSVGSPEGGQFNPEIVPDGAGGAIVAWQDLRSELSGPDIFAQHILATGLLDPAWPDNGVALCVAAGAQTTHAMVPDGTGGAIVTWVDSRVSDSEPDIFAQRVVASGHVDTRWPVNGTPICNAAGPQGFPAIVSDGSSGAIIMWHDARPGSLGFDVYAQHVLNTGVADPAWPVNGRAVCTAAGDQGRGTITSDGLHGAIVVWTDSRVFATDHIFAQHVLATGATDPVWPVNGRGISNAAIIETRPRAVPDGVGGAVVTWQGFTTQLNIYAQHVRSTGVVDPVWPAAGRAITDAKRQQSNAEIASDSAGGAIVAWVDSVDVVAQHVLSTGLFDPTYPANGRSIVNLSGRQGEAAIVATTDAGAIVAWTDGRNQLSTDIFALQVKEAGQDLTGVNTPPAAGVLVSVVPNPFSGSTRISFGTSGNGPVAVRIFDVLGRPVRSLAVAGGASARDVQWDGRTSGGSPAPSGIYFCRVSTPAGQGVRRIVLVR